MPKSGSKSVSGAMSKRLSRLWAVFLFLVAFVSTAAHAPGQILLSGHSGQAPTHKARVPATGGSATLDDQFILLSHWEDDELGAPYSAWNEFDSGTLEFEKPRLDVSGAGGAPAWNAFPPNSLLAISQAANDFNHRSLAASWGGGSGGGSPRASGKAPSTPAAPAPSADTPANIPLAPDTTQPSGSGSAPDNAGPTETNPHDETPTLTDAGTSPPANTGMPPTQREPVNVPEPATFGLFALSLTAMMLARRRSPARRRG